MLVFSKLFKGTTVKSQLEGITPYSAPSIPEACKLYEKKR